MRKINENSIRNFEIETLISYLKVSYLIFLVYTKVAQQSGAPGHQTFYNTGSGTPEPRTISIVLFEGE